MGRVARNIHFEQILPENDSMENRGKRQKSQTIFEILTYIFQYDFTFSWAECAMAVAEYSQNYTAAHLNLSAQNFIFIITKWQKVGNIFSGQL